ncbi:MAG: ABC transporter permease [Methanobacteriaceae archaeon]|nr:ABC transporter permease [Methanobacteriaceae archaeon]
MLNFIEMEFLKLKNSKIFLLTILGALFPAFLLLLGHLEDPSLTFTYEDIISNILIQYVIALFAVLLCSIVISYLIGREYNEHTLKSIMTVPTSRIKYIVGKYLMFFIWTMILMIIAFLSSILVGFIGGATGFSFEVLLEGLFKLLYGGFLIFLTMSPFIFIAMIINSMVPAMICGAALMLANLMVSSQSVAPYFPWLAPYLIVSNTVAEYSCPSYVPYLVIFLTFIIGFVISYIYFTKKDIYL